MSSLTPVAENKVQTGSVGTGKQLSAGLKERLKRCGRYHSTPPSAKRPQTMGLTTNMTSPNSALAEKSLNKQPPHTAVGSPFQCLPNENTQAPVVGSKGDNSVDSRGNNPVVSRGDNSFTPKPLGKTCPRRVNTSLSFKSPVLKPVINNNCETPQHAVSSYCEDAPQISNLSSVESPALSDNVSTPLSSKNSLTSRRGSGCNKNKLVFNEDGDVTASVGDGLSDSDTSRLKKEKKDLLAQLAVTEERLRKLKMVKMYRAKNNLDELQKLINKWRGVSQQAVSDLHQLLPEPRPSLADFVQHLQIDNDLVQIELEDE